MFSVDKPASITQVVASDDAAPVLPPYLRKPALAPHLRRPASTTLPHLHGAVAIKVTVSDWHTKVAVSDDAVFD